MSADHPGDEEAAGPGRRKDGKPFKKGNTRGDGSYDVGKYRPPSKNQFRKGDGRPRGKREKGSMNLSKIWAKKLKQKMKYEGKEQTATEWLVEGMIRRGIAKSDRAAETSLNEASRLENNRERHLGKSDADIMEAWLMQWLTEAEGGISDDAGGSKDDETGAQDRDADDADQ